MTKKYIILTAFALLFMAGCPTGTPGTTDTTPGETGGDGDGDGDSSTETGEVPPRPEPSRGPFDMTVCQDREPVITEGTTYSAAEQAITGIEAHGAIDIAPTTGDKRHADVFAAREGCAVASEQIFVIDAPAGDIGFGGGKIIEVLHPDGSRTGYYHLSLLADEIPFYEGDPSVSPDGYDGLYPWVVVQNDADFMEYCVPVEKGQYLGETGVTGLSAPGQTETGGRDAEEVPSWDEDHLHLEVFIRDQNGSKVERFDPTGIDGSVDDVPNLYATVFDECPSEEDRPGWLFTCIGDKPKFPDECLPNPDTTDSLELLSDTPDNSFLERVQVIPSVPLPTSDDGQSRFMSVYGPEGEYQIECSEQALAYGCN